MHVFKIIELESETYVKPSTLKVSNFLVNFCPSLVSTGLADFRLIKCSETC